MRVNEAKDFILQSLEESLLSALESAFASARSGSEPPWLRIWMDLPANATSSHTSSPAIEPVRLATVDLSRFCDDTTVPGLESALLDASPQTDGVDPSPPFSPVSEFGDEESDDSDARPCTRRKVTGALRIGTKQHQSAASESVSRRLKSDSRNFPQRGKRRFRHDAPTLSPSNLDRLVVGIWEQIHGSINFDYSALIYQWREVRSIPGTTRLLADAGAHPVSGELTDAPDNDQVFRRANRLCSEISKISRCCRALEIVVQARWTELFDERVGVIAQASGFSPTKSRMVALGEACQDFGWSEKELRNKMAVWRGYREIKDAGGWVSLVFAGMGIYRFCKYRADFSEQSLNVLRMLQPRFEVAADTIHPTWRQLLSVIQQPTERVYHGHPHDWVVRKSGAPVPLTSTYAHLSEPFSFEQMDACVVDPESWDWDPRDVTPPDSHPADFTCEICGKRQSEDSTENECQCYPEMFGRGARGFVPVQVFQSDDGKNNGLMACCPFERGVAIGEFVGLITKDLQDVDVMQSSAILGDYQIWQGKGGNYTKFVNHSCRPNSQFERFIWRGLQRVLLVSKGLKAGEEITADYSDDYWMFLKKDCLCGEACCRYRDWAKRGDGRVC